MEGSFLTTMGSKEKQESFMNSEEKEIFTATSSQENGTIDPKLTYDIAGTPQYMSPE